jgi:hypothetical protein
MGWNDVGMGAGGKSILKLENREKRKVHVIGEEAGGPAEPKSFFQYFNQKVQRGCVVGDDYTGQVDKRAQHALLVWDYTDESVKIWLMGNQLAAQVKGLFDSYENTLAGIDILITRVGEGKKTKYVLAPQVPSKFDAGVLEGVDLPDLDEKFAPASEEEIEQLKQGIVADSDDAGDAGAEEAAGTEEAAGEEAPAEEAGAEASDDTTEDAGAGEVDEEAELERQLAAAKAKKLAAAKAGAGKGGTATATKPTTAAPGKPATGDPRIALVKSITHKFATNAKYKTPAARMTAIKGVAKGKTTLSQLSVAELTLLSKKLG